MRKIFGIVGLFLIWGITFYSYSFISSYKNMSTNNVYALIPHHNLANKYIDEFYKEIKNTYGSFDTIVIISPNHFVRTQDDFISFPFDAKYCYKNEKNCINANKLSFYSGSVYDKKIFWKNILTEHWLWNHFEFINKYFPETKVYGVLLKIKRYLDIDMISLWHNLQKDFFQKTLFIASVDTSHHVNEKIAIFHDLKTIDVLNGAQGDVEVDCPNCVYLLKDLARNDNQKNFEVYNRTSVDTILKINSNFNNTSHMYGWYSKNQTKNISFSGWYLESEFDEKLPQQNNVSGIFFWDTHFTRWFRDERNKFKIQDYLQCFYQNKDREKLPNFWHNRLLYSFDIAGLNLETPVLEKKDCKESTKTINFQTDPKYLNNFKDIWFNVFNVANNHTFDCSGSGFTKTTKNLENLWVGYYGYESILKKEINGVKVALIWFDDTWYNKDYKKEIEQITQMKNDWYLVILNIHWGFEYKIQANERQKKLAKKFVDAGVKLIVWHHPHVVQNYEIYKWVPIFYSLWNFIFDQPFEETLLWQAVVFSIHWSWIKYNILNFKRNSKNYKIDCETFQ